MTDPQTTTLSGTGTSASSNDVRTVPDSISLMDTLPSSKSDESATNRVALLSNSHIGTNTGTDSNFCPYNININLLNEY